MNSHERWLEKHQKEIDSKFGGNVRLFMKYWNSRYYLTHKKQIYAQQKKNRMKNREKVNMQRREQYRRNKKKNKEYYMLHKDRILEYTRNVKLPTGGYAKMLKDQNGRCKLCGKKETSLSNIRKRRALALDHNHRTRKVRGLLCHRCNLKVACVEAIMRLSIKELYDVVRYIGVKRLLKRLNIVFKRC